MVLYPNKLPESERVCSGICTHWKYVKENHMYQLELGFIILMGGILRLIQELFR